jgi:hypothetical protein
VGYNDETTESINLESETTTNISTPPNQISYRQTAVDFLAKQNVKTTDQGLADQSRVGDF